MGVIFVEYIWNYQDRSDSGQSMMKMRQDNDVTNHTSPLYTKKNEIEMSCPIQQGMVYDEHQTGQQRDKSCMCGLSQNRTEMQ